MPVTDADELKLCQAMARSRYWRWMRGYLIARRETLLRQPAETNAALHQTKGALDEITRMLSAPELVAKYLAQQEADRSEPAEPLAAPAPDWLDGATRGGSDLVE